MYVLTAGTHLGSGCAGQLQGKILETVLSLKTKTCDELKITIRGWVVAKATVPVSNWQNFIINLCRISYIAITRNYCYTVRCLVYKMISFTDSYFVRYFS